MRSPLIGIQSFEYRPFQGIFRHREYRGICEDGLLDYCEGPASETYVFTCSGCPYANPPTKVLYSGQELPFYLMEDYCLRRIIA